MKPLALALPAALLLASPAMAQLKLAPQPGTVEITCAEFLALPSTGRLDALRSLSIGSVISPTDEAAALGFSEDVAEACREDPEGALSAIADRTLTNP